jgi:hypothetical protein
MNLSKFEIAITSPAIWSMIALFAYNGLEAILPQLGGTVGNVVSILLLILSGYLHTSHVQSVAAGQ